MKRIASMERRGSSIFLLHLHIKINHGRKDTKQPPEKRKNRV